jgi:predicted phage-related endonuclease
MNAVLQSVAPSPVVFHDDVVQGSDEWLALRRGVITASEMKLLLTPTLKVADNDKSRAHIYELLAQRISGYTEPQYISSDMLRGQEEEILARELYSSAYAPVQECGFVTNSQWGFTIGYSPDGLVGDDGLIEAKSRRQKYQVQTIVDHAVPDEYLLQCQTGLLVTGRKWLDFLSYSGGLPMAVIRVLPDPKVHEAIVLACRAAEALIGALLGTYQARAKTLMPTERRIEQEMVV